MVVCTPCITHLFGVILAFVLPLLIFMKGFVLTRHQLYMHSDTVKSPESHQKIIIVIIDALRYDFAAFRDDIAEGDTPYLNKLTVLRQLADDKGCESVRLFRFKADAPTTTMQRIKAMTTGGFPTFIDISSNFDSTEITEDNFIDQLSRSEGTNITFMGDDTWMKLFPGRFSSAYPFPSFNVKDLHTVDDGILRHLVSQVRVGNWKLLISHFLGVDHCGHRYGPNHHQMAVKLQQMNDMIRSVVNNMDNNTLLLVMGDHGMTQTGDHGGDSIDEVNAALFAYSSSAMFRSSWKNGKKFLKNCEAGVVQQIDIVPTLCWILNISTPFSNIGSIITELLPLSPDEEAQAVHANAKQILRYMTEYNKRYHTFPEHELATLRQSLASFKHDNTTTGQLLRAMADAREMCRGVWAQFDVAHMTAGGAMFTCTCLLLLGTIRKYESIALAAVLGSSAAVFSLLSSVAWRSFALLCAATVPIAITIRYRDICAAMTSFPVLAAALISPTLMTSNSFVVSEDRIALFLYVSSLMWFIRRSVRHQPTTTRKVAASREKRNNRSGGGWHHHLLLHFTHVRRFATAGLVGVVARAVVPAAWLCRPEQTWCYDFALLNTDNNSSDVVSSGDVGKERRSAKTERFWAESMASAFCLLFIVVSIRQVIKREGNAKKPLTAATICPTLLLPVCASFIFFHWIIQSFPDKQVSELPNASIVFLPLCTYFLLLVSALWWIVAPLTVHIMFPDRFGNYQHAPPQLSEREVVVHYCQMLKQELSDCKQQTLDANLDIEENDLRGRKQLPPAVFGLYTLMSASVIGVGEVVLLLLSLLLDRVLVVATFVLTTPIVIDIVTTSHIDDQFVVSWAAVAVWHLSSVHWWFISGHQASLASIPWQAAFVGVQGNHATVVLPALMVTAHVFASQIIHTVCLPLLALWPIARSRKDHRASRFNSEHEFLISDQFWPSVNQLFFKHITLHAFKLLGCIVSTFVHRRHLMVWQIFAPRFLYESLSFLVVCATSLATYLYLLRINWCTSRWITSVQSDRRFRVT